MIEEYPYTIEEFAGIKVVPLLLHIDDSGHFSAIDDRNPDHPTRVPGEGFKQETD
jgi:hypothetical protein